MPRSAPSLTLIKCFTNLYSRSFIFGNPLQEPDKMLFVKVIESGDAVEDFRHFDAEIKALSIATNVRVDNRIIVPTLYCHSRSLKAVALQYVEGDILFNVLWNRRQLHGLLFPLNPDHGRLLHDLFSWMRLFHYSKDVTRDDDLFEQLIWQDFHTLVKRKEFLDKKRIPFLDMPLIEYAIVAVERYLKTHTITNRSIVLTHGDLTLFNMLFSGGKVYILDFAHSRAGRPEDDFSRLACDVISIQPLAALRTDGIHKTDVLGKLFRSFLEHPTHSEGLLWLYLIKNIFINLTTYANHFSRHSITDNLRYIILLQMQQRFLRRVLREQGTLSRI